MFVFVFAFVCAFVFVFGGLTRKNGLAGSGFWDGPTSMDVCVMDPARLGQTALSDGRNLGWAEWGPEAGTPVLFCPGAATSRFLGFGGDIVEELGVRLISVDRPGLGASDPAPGRTLTDWAQDIEQFARLKELPSLAVVAYSQGAPFGIACAQSNIVEALAIVCGTDELAHPSFADELAPDIRRIVANIAADPTAAEAFFRGFPGADFMWEMILRMNGSEDLIVYTEPAFERAFRRAMTEAFSQGAAGYATDCLLAMSRWPFDLGAIRVPVDIWYGALDKSPVHSPDFGVRLAQRIPSARRHFLPDAGGAMLWTHSRDILCALLGA